MVENRYMEGWKRGQTAGGIEYRVDSQRMEQRTDCLRNKAEDRQLEGWSGGWVAGGMSMVENVYLEGWKRGQTAGGIEKRVDS